MDVISLPVYSWGCAAGFAIRMASRLTGRNEVLVAKTAGPERLGAIISLCGHPSMPGHINVDIVGFASNNGLLDIDALKSKISSRTAAVYFENPSYLGCIESQGSTISRLAHENGAVTIVGVDPISLGVLCPPPDYGADIVVGTLQSLGVHMQCGGGVAGFIASRDEEDYVAEYPTTMESILTTMQEGEFAFGHCAFERTSYVKRDKAKDFYGTTSTLWAISAAVYMALMGPQGFREIGELIIQRSKYAAKLLAEISGIKILLSNNSFKEFVVNFNDTGKNVKDINKALLAHKIFGGKDISSEFPELGNSALYCVTEIHSQDDIEKLADALKEVVSQ
ncbi:putative glycine dehydrogenase (decarboxylating) subunit 1 [subsurface metagenome]